MIMHSKVTSLHVVATVPCVISVGLEQEKAQKATVQRPFVALEQACLLESRLVYFRAGLSTLEQHSNQSCVRSLYKSRGMWTEKKWSVVDGHLQN